MSKTTTKKKTVERRVKSVIAGNTMAGLSTPPATIKRMKAVAAGTVTADQAIAAVLSERRRITKAS